MMRHSGIGMVLEGKTDRPMTRPVNGLLVYHSSPAAARLARLSLATPVWFLARPRLLTRSIPLPMGRDIRLVSG
jgi:hypothetical protein